VINAKRRYKWGAIIGLLAGGMSASVATGDNIHGAWLLLWLAGLLLGLLVAHITVMRSFERAYQAATGLHPWDVYRAEQDQRRQTSD
jgi:hypothetical protein